MDGWPKSSKQVFCSQANAPKMYSQVLTTILETQLIQHNEIL